MSRLATHHKDDRTLTVVRFDMGERFHLEDTRYEAKKVNVYTGCVGAGKAEVSRAL